MRGEEPPCKTCTPPLLEANRDALKVYLMCEGQFIMGFGGPVDINQVAVHECMRLYEVRDKVDCFEKVVAVARHEINRLAERRENEK